MYKFKIKSKSKNYYVCFSNNLIPSLKQNFHKNDFIIADKKIRLLVQLVFNEISTFMHKFKD